jgi:NAD(P)-dependent dehydrogenase (short-subunit alcohol dehydrogenase family)
MTSRTWLITGVSSGFGCELATQLLDRGDVVIGVTIVEPGGTRTEFRYGSAQVADLPPAYDGTPAHGFLAVG